MIKLFKKKYIVVFLNKEQESFNIVGKRFITATTEIIKYSKNKSIPIDVSKHTFGKGLKLFYFVDLSTFKQIYFENKEDNGINAEVIDMILQKRIIKDLTSNLGEKTNFNTSTLMHYLVGAIIGGLFCFILASYLNKFGVGL